MTEWKKECICEKMTKKQAESIKDHQNVVLTKNK